MYKRILVPIDGSDVANHGLSEAIRLATPWKATLCLLHVICESPFVEEMANPADPQAYLHSLQLRARHLLAAAEKLVRAAGLNVETRVRELKRGRAGDAIVEEAAIAGCDLVVMGTHRLHAFERLVVGSVAERVLRGSPIPVLSVGIPPASPQHGLPPPH